ncbi:MAG: hypothetical protein Q8P89_01500 [bacterium]|nr:hypothetical protein [bacterium]
MGGNNEVDKSSTLRESVDNTLAQIGKLGQGLVRTVEAGQVGQFRPEVVAALAWIRGLAEAGEKFIGQYGGVIYDGDGAKSGETVIGAAAVALTETKAKAEGTEPERVGRPTTFGELLQLRINQALPRKKQFIWEDLSKYAIRGGIKSVKEQGLLNKKKFSRQEAAVIVWRLLTSPTATLATRESYAKKQAINSFRLHKDQLDKWCNEIGYVWGKNDEVDFETAMQVRGLGYLEDVLASQEN